MPPNYTLEIACDYNLGFIVILMMVSGTNEKLASVLRKESVARLTIASICLKFLTFQADSFSSVTVYEVLPINASTVQSLDLLLH